MHLKKTTAGAVAVAASLGLAVSMQPASAIDENPLAPVLLENGQAPAFDNKGKDYDIVANAALAVVGANADSPLSILLDGSKRATVFLPQDRAFTALVGSLLNQKVSEEVAFNTLVDVLGVDKIEQVLLYHGVGKTYTAKKLSKLKKKKRNLKTFAGPRITVVKKKKKIFIKDLSPDTKNARVVKANLNKGNKQLAHGINGILLPAAVQDLLAS